MARKNIPIRTRLTSTCMYVCMYVCMTYMLRPGLYSDITGLQLGLTKFITLCTFHVTISYGQTISTNLLHCIICVFISSHMFRPGLVGHLQGTSIMCASFVYAQIITLFTFD